MTVLLTEMGLPEPPEDHQTTPTDPAADAESKTVGADAIEDSDEPSVPRQAVDVLGVDADGNLIGVTADETQAPNAHLADTAALADDDYLCQSPVSSDEEALAALDRLISSVEREESLPVQIDTAVHAIHARGLIRSQELAARIAQLEGLEIVPAQLRVSGLALLVELGCHDDVYVRKAAHDTLKKGPLDRSQAPVWETAASLLPLPGADADPADILSSLALIFGDDAVAA